MKKRLLAALLASSLMMTLIACGTETEPQNDTEVEVETPVVAQDQTADIVIIGAGGAGMTAAIEAYENGATNVVIVEKSSMTGGNTTRATGGLNASETIWQDAAGIEDSNALFIEDTMVGGGNLNDPTLVETLVNNSADAVDFVNEIGGELSTVGMFGGASVERIHTPADKSAVGPMLVETLNNNIADREIPVLLNTNADEILVNNGTIEGVVVTGPEGTYTISATAVVLATGGFGNNADMVVSYNAELEGFGTTNGPTSTGDGIAMAVAIGASLTDIEQIQTHPTVNPDTNTMYTEGVRGSGAILVNAEGSRFVNELETRDVVSEAILAQDQAYSWLVFDQEVRESVAATESYFKAGIIVEGETLEELAVAIGADVDTFVATMENYTAMQNADADTEFDRASMVVSLDNGPFYAGKCVPAVHHTMGGVTITTEAEVMSLEGTPINGLFAAGEVTGGVHGTNRLGGNAVTDIVVFGRIAGSSAALYVEENGGFTDSSITNAADVDVVPAVQGDFEDGVYQGVGTGFGGDLNVTVTVEGNNIVDIALGEHGDTDGIYQSGFEGVSSAIIINQEVDVDTVSGATGTSNGVIEAVKNALGL